MNNQMTRLYKAAKDLRKLDSPSEIARLLGESPQTVKNWESRGISDRGLIAAQEHIGCDAIWLRDGIGDMIRGVPRESVNFDQLAEIIRLYGESTSKGRDFILDSSKHAEKGISNNKASGMG